GDGEGADPGRRAGRRLRHERQLRLHGRPEHRLRLPAARMRRAGHGRAGAVLWQALPGDGRPGAALRPGADPAQELTPWDRWRPPASLARSKRRWRTRSLAAPVSRCSWPTPTPAGSSTSATPSTATLAP